VVAKSLGRVATVRTEVMGLLFPARIVILANGSNKLIIGFAVHSI